MSKLHLSGVLAALLLAPAALTAAPQSFESPDAAVNAVIAALEAKDADELVSIFGDENRDVILSGDAERDRDDWRTFYTAYQEMHRTAEQEEGGVRLYVGTDQWPFPVMLVKEGDAWSFDAASAADEIAAGRIGRNELDVIDIMHGYVDVQRAYREFDYDEDGIMEFAAHVLSSEGERDGLYWPDEEGAPESPIGDFIARAAAEGYAVGGEVQTPEPYLGYYFHILTKQGENAPGGAMDYMVNGSMLAGHALLAFPAVWGETGVMSFMVSENGVVLEADLGEDTLDKAVAIEAYDPGEGWAPVEATEE